MILNSVCPAIHEELSRSVGTGDYDVLVTVVVEIKRHEAPAVAGAVHANTKADVEEVASVEVHIGVIRFRSIPRVVLDKLGTVELPFVVVEGPANRRLEEWLSKIIRLLACNETVGGEYVGQSVVLEIDKTGSPGPFTIISARLFAYINKLITLPM
jgi:hypothetical protein